MQMLRVAVVVIVMIFLGPVCRADAFGNFYGTPFVPQGYYGGTGYAPGLGQMTPAQAQAQADWIYDSQVKAINMRGVQPIGAGLGVPLGWDAINNYRDTGVLSDEYYRQTMVRNGW